MPKSPHDPAAHAGRTDFKIRFARIHLNELKSQPRRGSGSDFERAHEEAFLAQLIGARDAFLQELNAIYGCGLDLEAVSMRTLSQHFLKSGRPCQELIVLQSLQDDDQSWLAACLDMRNHATHRYHISRYYVRGSGESRTYLKQPSSDRHHEQEPIELFERWLIEMEALIAKLRASTNEVVGPA